MALHRKYKKLAVEDLIALINDETCEKDNHNLAINEFHFRFKDYFFKVCKNTCTIKGIFDKEEINKLTYDSMQRMYKGLHTFKPIGDGVPEKEKLKNLCGWISVIIRRVIKKYLDDFEKFKDKIILTENIDSYAAYVDSLPDEEEEISLPNQYQVLLEEALSHIIERDKEITFTYLEYQDENGRIPTEILNRLLKKYNLTPKYPAKIKDRTIKKLLLINHTQIKSLNHGKKPEKSRKKARGNVKRLPPLDRPDDTADAGSG